MKPTSLLIIYLIQFVCTSKMLLFQDQTSSRPNTLSDDADDIQRQLDNEAKDREKYGKPKSIWVLHFPTQFPEMMSIADLTRYPRDEDTDELLYSVEGQKNNSYLEGLSNSRSSSKKWTYKDQNIWHKLFSECGGQSQSPVNLPIQGLIKAEGGRTLEFVNFNSTPENLTVYTDSTTLTLYGEWSRNCQPMIRHGALYSRKYKFHSLIVHSPSEHTVATLQYPVETQALFIAGEYRDWDHALASTGHDKQAFVAISTMYIFRETSHQSLSYLINALKKHNILQSKNYSKPPLNNFIPTMKEYACYQGSLSFPPCSEAVIWLVRRHTLSITRRILRCYKKHKLTYVQKNVDKLDSDRRNNVIFVVWYNIEGTCEKCLVKCKQDMISLQLLTGWVKQPVSNFSRRVQPLNDRPVYYFR